MARPLVASLLVGAAILTILFTAPMSAQAAATTVTAKYAGGITGTFGGFSITNPTGVVRQGSTLYVLDAGADSNRGRVFQFTLNVTDSGPVTTAFVRSWGARGTNNQNITPATFGNPQGIAISHNGLVSVADTGNNRVLQFTATGGFSRTIGSAGSGNRQFRQPSAIAQSPIGNQLYVLDRQVGGSTAPRIQYFNPGGNYQGQFNGGTFGAIANTASGLSVGPDGRVIVTDTGNHRLLAYTAAGIPIRQTGSGPGTNLNQFDAPRAMEIASDAFAVALDTGANNRVIAYNLAGGVASAFASFTGPSSAVAGVSLPANPTIIAANDAVYGSDDLLILADSGRSRVQFMWLEYGYEPLDPEYPLIPIGYDGLSCTDCHLADMRLEHDLKTSHGCASCHNVTGRSGKTDYSLLGKQLAEEKLLMGYESMGSCGSESNHCHSVASGQGYHAQDGGRMQIAHWTYSAPGVRATTSYCSGSAGACHSYGSTTSDLWFGSMDIASAHADYYQYQVTHYDDLESEFADPNTPSVPGTVDITQFKYGCKLCHDPTFYQSHGKATKEAAFVTNGRFGCPSCHVIPRQGVPGFGSYSASNPTCYRTEHWSDVSSVDPRLEGMSSGIQSIAAFGESAPAPSVDVQVSLYIQRVIEGVGGSDLDAMHDGGITGMTMGDDAESVQSLPAPAIPATSPMTLADILGNR